MSNQEINKTQGKKSKYDAFIKNENLLTGIYRHHICYSSLPVDDRSKIKE